MSALAHVDAPRFTPGPWEAGFNPMGDYTNETVVRPAGQFPHGEWIADVGAGSVNAERMANAHLIAAAPDLYMALARLLSLCEAGGDPFEEPNRVVVNQAISALSKANPHLPSGAAACAADSPAGSTSSPIPSGTNSNIAGA